ncbi:zona pellucida sperm-binding protein 3-like isoform X2 [Heteronotia binoei]|uniref:zona pellucida sperm-binding protein 3-like isoform X2 n=1 Tax=Heteronotia binoei TaxID=13085 RepID=UPI0029306F97|nr:zona pellucida sperm-binding protein 3-like isoform X2 [Heteronotia binoei]
MMGCFFCVVFLGLLAAQVLAQGNGLPNPSADSISHPGTTAEAGFLRRVYNAKSMVWHDAPTTMSTTKPGSAIASPSAHLLVMQELEGVAQMNFSLRVLNEDLSVAEEPAIYDKGSPIYLEARVQTTPGTLFPKIFIDECYGTETKEQIHPRRLYVIAYNHGCLYSEELETVSSWFRKADSAIVFTVPAFSVTGIPAEEIYIHCLLTAWSQKTPTSSGKKTCYFNRASSSWKNIDEPSKTSVCNCCDSFCPMESPYHENFKASFVGEGRLHREVAGPLTVLKGRVPWFEERCHTIKGLLLATFAFLGSFVLMVFFIGAILALIMAFTRISGLRKKHQLLVNKMEQDSDTELKTVAGALAAGALEVADQTEESNLDYCKLKGDTPEKA